LALGKRDARRDGGNERGNEGKDVAGRLEECMAVVDFGTASAAERLRAFRDVVVEK
jgi:hypothetical protein